MLPERLMPTEIVELNYSSNKNRIYVKRDDLIPFCFGGNKARRAFHLFKEVLSQGYDSIVVYGSSSSNLCRAVANFSASFGIECYVVSPMESFTETNNNKIINLCGSKTITCPLEKVSETIQETLKHLSLQKKNPFFAGGG